MKRLLLRAFPRARALVALSLVMLVTLGGCGLIIGIPDHDLLLPAADAGEDVSDASSADGFVPAMDASFDATIVDAFVPCDGADFNVDPQNCGRCGHDCVVGACASGVCQPVALAVSTGTPILLAVNDTEVFWTESANDIQAAPKDGGNAAILGSSLQGIDRLALDRTYVYYAVINSSVDYAGIDASAGSGVTAGYQQVAALFVFNGILYVATSESGSSSGLFACTSLPIASCPAVIQNLNNNAGSYFRDFQADDGGFVFTASENVGGAVWTCPITGCAGSNAQQLAANAGSQLNLAITKNDIFWIDADGGAGQIYHCDRSGCMLSKKAIAPNEVAPKGIAADETYVYWTDQARGRVLACPHAGCPDGGPMILVEGGAPSAIALDSTSIFFANAVNAGTIERVGKP